VEHRIPIIGRREREVRPRIGAEPVFSPGGFFFKLMGSRDGGRTKRGGQTWTTGASAGPDQRAGSRDRTGSGWRPPRPAGRERELLGTAVTAGFRLFRHAPMSATPSGCSPARWDGRRDEAFVDDKIWTPSKEGAAQLARAGTAYGRPGRPHADPTPRDLARAQTMLQAARDAGRSACSTNPYPGGGLR